MPLIWVRSSGSPLGFLKPFHGALRRRGAGVRALEDAGRLAATAAEIVELGATDLAAADDLDLGDVGRVDRENALDALAVGDLADSEALVDAGAGAANDDAFVGLQADGLLSPSPR